MPYPTVSKPTQAPGCGAGACVNKNGGHKIMARRADANRKKFVRYKEGAELYSMCQSKFERMAKEAKAIYKVDKVVLVNCDIFEEYLETFRLEC